MRVIPPKGGRSSAMRFHRASFFYCWGQIYKMDKMKNKAANGSNDSGPNKSENSVHSVEKPLPNSKKIYVAGELHPDLRVPFREITLAPTKSLSGELEVNEPVRVYGPSGPWGDPLFRGDVEQ